MSELNELLKEIEKIIKVAKSYPNADKLTWYSPLALPNIAFIDLETKYLNYKNAVYKCEKIQELDLK